jgi:hypothetical protein
VEAGSARPPPAAAGAPLEVRAGGDLRRLPRRARGLSPFGLPRVRVRVAEMEEGEARAWEARLEALRAGCGCAEGALALGAFLLAAVAAAVAAEPPVPASPAAARGVLLAGGALFLAGLAASALLGKLAGRARAALRFHRACDALERRVRSLQAG